MSGPIDLSAIKPGGKVSVTLTDGTKIIDSPVKDYLTRSGGALFIAGRIQLMSSRGGLGLGIASIDAYTPPTPEWDRPEVCSVFSEGGGGIWVRSHRDPGVWWQQSLDTLSTDRLAEKLPNLIVHSVYAEGVRP